MSRCIFSLLNHHYCCILKHLYFFYNLYLLVFRPPGSDEGVVEPYLSSTWRATASPFDLCLSLWVCFLDLVLDNVSYLDYVRWFFFLISLGKYKVKLSVTILSCRRGFAPNRSACHLHSSPGPDLSISHFWISLPCLIVLHTFEYFYLVLYFQSFIFF